VLSLKLNDIVLDMIWIERKRDSWAEVQEHGVLKLWGTNG